MDLSTRASGFWGTGKLAAAIGVAIAAILALSAPGTASAYGTRSYSGNLLITQNTAYIVNVSSTSTTSTESVSWLDVSWSDGGGSVY